MSWILRHKRKLAKMSGCLVIMFLTCSVFRFHIHVIIANVGICIILGVLFMINKCVLQKNARMKNPFGDYSGIRNMDYLIVGSSCKPSRYVPEGKSYVEICLPGRGKRAALEILKHTHSILNENGGTVIMPITPRKIENFSPFDILFFHNITIKKYGLQKLQKEARYPILYAPLTSLLFFLNYSGYHFIEKEAPEDIATFCQERGYQLIYMESKNHRSMC